MDRELRYKNGSYCDYYTNFRKELDPRMIIFDQTNVLNDVTGPILALDIGCNTGVLTKEIYQKLALNDRQVKMLGMDISQELIDRANEVNEYENLKYICQDIVEIAMGPEDEDSFIKKYLAENEKSKFDIISCFSTTMYIHLIYGDEGLKKFLSYICQLGEYLILEPQPFKKYRHHRERVKKENKHKGPHDPYPCFPEKEGKIKWRHNLEVEITNYIKNLGFEIIFESKSDDWDRQILIFKRRKAI